MTAKEPAVCCLCQRGPTSHLGIGGALVLYPAPLGWAHRQCAWAFYRIPEDVAVPAGAAA